MATIAFENASFSTGHPCTTSDTLDNPVTPTVFIEGQRPLLSGATATHIYETIIMSGTPPAPTPVCVDSHSITYTGGSATVFVNGYPIGFVGDAVEGGTVGGPGATTVFCS